jgi:hypothetical protein
VKFAEPESISGEIRPHYFSTAAGRKMKTAGARGVTWKFGLASTTAIVAGRFTGEMMATAALIGRFQGRVRRTGGRD